MDDRQFDRLTRGVFTGWRQSRRAALMALLAAAMPRPASAQCANPCDDTRCGAVRNACGQVFDCGDPCPRYAYPENECVLGICSPEGYCSGQVQPNNTVCWGIGEIGICCDGECVRGPCL